MRSFKPNHLLAIFLATVLAACSSTQEQQDTSATDSAPVDTTESTAEAAPVQEEAPVEANETAIPMTADNFHSHPDNYTNSTDTKTIYFEFDRFSIPATAFEALRAHAAHLKSVSTAKVRLEGHADERGTREYNVALSERRANAVERFLRLQGVPASQIEVVAYGEEKPAAYGHTEMDWARNRRVELNYLSGRP